MQITVRATMMEGIRRRAVSKASEYNQNHFTTIFRATVRPVAPDATGLATKHSFPEEACFNFSLTKLLSMPS